jgi:hypothetical protein
MHERAEWVRGAIARVATECPAAAVAAAVAVWDTAPSRAAEVAGRVGTFHNDVLLSKHGSMDDSQYGPCNHSATRE